MGSCCPNRTGRVAGWCGVAAALALGVPPAAAQAPAADPPVVPRAVADSAWFPVRLASPLDELLRTAALAGARPLEPRLVRRGLGWPPDDEGRPLLDRLLRPGLPTVTLLPARTRTVLNTGYPRVGNDGLLWAGRGVSMVVGGGVAARWGVLSATLAPEAAWQQNRDFETRPVSRTGFSEYIYPFHTIDLPQRFGDDAFGATGWGQSVIRADAGPVAAGLSGENQWWGPARRYPILMGAAAPGFPHFFLGSARPVQIGIGQVEAQVIGGRLTESDHFDENPDNDHAMLLGVTASFAPRWLPGLWLGGARVYQYRPEGDGWHLRGMLSEVFKGQGAGNRPGNELASLFGRWAFPAVGFEAYGEWAREDRWGELYGLIMEPEHSQAYMLGVEQVAGLTDDAALRFGFELVALQRMGEPRTRSRPLPVYYAHHEIIQGYTHRGRLVGAWVGPGADAQFLTLDGLFHWGTAGAYFERVRRHTASSVAYDARRWSPYDHDVELTLGLRSQLFPYPGVAVAAALTRSYRYHRDFLDHDRNLGVDLEATWTPTRGAGRR